MTGDRTASIPYQGDHGESMSAILNSLLAAGNHRDQQAIAKHTTRAGAVSVPNTTGVRETSGR